MRLWPGHPYPLGATWDGAGVNFALYAENATKVELCLFDSADATAGSAADRRQGIHRQGLARRTCPTCFPASSTGTACTGRSIRRRAPVQPQQGRARPVRQVDRSRRMLGRLSSSAIELHDAEADLSFDDRDSAAYAPLATVIDPAFTWGDDRPPRTPWHKTVIYELHVKGFTQLNPAVPEKLRGSYAGLASESAIKHLTDLGVTAVELLPVHYHLDDRHSDRERAARITGGTTRWVSWLRSPTTVARAFPKTTCSSSR